MRSNDSFWVGFIEGVPLGITIAVIIYIVGILA